MSAKARLDDAALARLLGHWQAPPPGDDLAARIVAEAVRVDRPRLPPPVRNRGRWTRRGLWTGIVAFNLVLASAVAAAFGGGALDLGRLRVVADRVIADVMQHPATIHRAAARTVRHRQTTRAAPVVAQFARPLPPVRFARPAPPHPFAHPPFRRSMRRVPHERPRMAWHRRGTLRNAPTRRFAFRNEQPGRQRGIAGEQRFTGDYGGPRFRQGPFGFDRPRWRRFDRGRGFARRGGFDRPRGGWAGPRGGGRPWRRRR